MSAQNKGVRIQRKDTLDRMISDAQKPKRNNLSKFRFKVKQKEKEIKIDDDNISDNSIWEISSESASLKWIPSTVPSNPLTCKQNSIDISISNRKGTN